MSKNSGIIYDLGENRYGVAIHSEQDPVFVKYKKVFLHVYMDRLCTVPELDPVTGKKYVTLKDLSTIKAIGYSD